MAWKSISVGLIATLTTLTLLFLINLFFSSSHSLSLFLCVYIQCTYNVQNAIAKYSMDESNHRSNDLRISKSITQLLFFSVNIQCIHILKSHSTVPCAYDKSQIIQNCVYLKLRHPNRFVIKWLIHKLP